MIIVVVVELFFDMIDVLLMYFVKDWTLMGARSSGMVGATIWMFPKIWENPPNHPFVHRVFHYTHSILGVKQIPLFLGWKNPYVQIIRFLSYNHRENAGTLAV